MGVKGRRVGCAMICVLLLAGCKDRDWWRPRESARRPSSSPVAGKKLCILVSARDETMAQFPMVQLNAARWVGDHLAKLVQLNLVDPKKVSAYQESNADWDVKPPTEIGRLFKADLVLFVDLVRYTTRDEQSPELYRGRVEALCELHDCAGPAEREVIWSGVVEGVYPKDKPIVVSRDQEPQIRRVMLDMLGSGVARQMHHMAEERS